MLRNDDARPLGDPDEGDGGGTCDWSGGGDFVRRAEASWDYREEERVNNFKRRLQTRALLAVQTMSGSCSSGTSFRESLTGVTCAPVNFNKQMRKEDR